MSADTGYRLPPGNVVELLTAVPEPAIVLSPNSEWLIYVERESMPRIEELARRKLPLAGIRIDPVANSVFRTDYYRGLAIRRISDESLTPLMIPDGSRLSWVSWSHTSEAFVFAVVTDSGTQLWGVRVDEPNSCRLLTNRLSTVMGGIDWMPDGEHFLCRLVPESRGIEPIAPLRPVGPSIQTADGTESPSRTYQDLLSSPHDEELFDYYAVSQLAIVGLSGSVRTVGKPALIDSFEVSPDGQHLLVSTLKRPFSYMLPYSLFPKEFAVWNLDGERTYLIADVPLEENIPIEGVRIGPRGMMWASSEPARLYWFEALDGGDPRKTVAHRDRLMSLNAPFKGTPEEVRKIEHRASGLSFFRDKSLIALSEYDRDRRWLRTILHDVSKPDDEPRVFVDRSIRDQYGDPGDLVRERNEQGHSVAKQDGSWVFLAGNGASPAGYLPFLDRRDLGTLKTERLWRCEAGVLESVAAIRPLSRNVKPEIITRRESQTVPSNLILRDLERATERALTSFADPTPQIRGIKKELIKYQRADGVPLSATMYLPADYQPGTRLPLFVWAYPQEFSDAATAGQVTSSPSQFIRLRGTTHLSLVTQGYAVMDNATMPVVGDPETMNDTFVEQIVAAAQAAIDKAVDMGVADRHRVAVGGHSYGAFMTANLLAHCSLFKAGVARSGAYNRTLTPFGFQAERRPLWQAKSVYMNLSPFLQADKIKTPLLLIHGEDDNNSGTFPMQSQRLFQAIKGTGGTARLVLLPHESHGYVAAESVLHVQAETIDWLNRYVRDAKPE